MKADGGIPRLDSGPTDWAPGGAISPGMSWDASGPEPLAAVQLSPQRQGPVVRPSNPRVASHSIQGVHTDSKTQDVRPRSTVGMP